MNHTGLLRRALDITRRYPVLWIFGILVALTAGGAGGAPNFQWNMGGNDLANPPAWLPYRQWDGPWAGPWTEMGDWFGAIDPGAWAGVVLCCCCALVILAILAIIVSYVARAALIRSTNQIEGTGIAPTWREGFRLGWSKRTFRLFLLELLVGIGVFLVTLLIFALAAAPLLLLVIDSGVARGIGIGASVLLGIVAICVAIAGAVALYVLGHFWSREVLLDDRNIGEAFSTGIADVRSRLGDLAVLWLLMAGIGIGFGLLMIPVVLIVGGLAALAGGGLGYAIHAITGSVGWAIALGLPLFFVILAIPLTLIGGLFEVFKSGAWTLAYRDVKGRSTLSEA